MVPLPPSAVLHEVWAGATLLGPPVTATVSLEQSERAVHLLTSVTLSALVCSKAGRQHSTHPPTFAVAAGAQGNEQSCEKQVDPGVGSFWV